MNNQAPTYNEFKSYRPGTTVSSDTFSGLIADSEAYVDAFIYPNTVDAETPAWIIEAYKRAICAALQFTYDYPSGVPTSYTAGKVHETFGKDAEQSTRESEVNYYLSGTGLLCRWL